MEENKSKKEIKWFDAMRDHFTNQFTGHHAKMLTYSFKDFGDTGDYDGCKSLKGVATYNYVSINVTQLPADVRFGLCFPKECEQWMMNKAEVVLSDTISRLIYKLADIFEIGMILKYKVGMYISFIQPEHWIKEQRRKKSKGAFTIISLIIFAFLTVVMWSWIRSFEPWNKKRE